MANRIPLVTSQTEFINQLQTADVLADVNGLRYVRGPASATDDTVARFDGTSGTLIQGSGVIITDTTNRVSAGGNPQTSPNGAFTTRGTDLNGSSLFCYRVSGDAGGPNIRMFKARGTPGSEADVQVGDVLNTWTFNAWRNGEYQGDGGDPASGVIICRVAIAVSGDSVPCLFEFWTTPSGGVTNELAMTIGAAKDVTVYGSIVVNEGGYDLDSRFEGDTATHLLYLDAGLDAVQIGTTSAGDIADFRSTGYVFNESGVDRDMRWEGDTATHLVYIDAGLDAFQIGTTSAGDIADFRSTRITLKKFVNFGAATELTIATGVVTATKSYHTVDTEADAATDDLDTINGGSEGDILVIRASDDARTVVAKDATGNLQLAGDFSLDNTQDSLTLFYTGAAWVELSRSDNGA